MTEPASVLDEPPADWDALAVDRPGGHVYQSTAWAEHRRAGGWRPRFVRAAGQAILVLTRDWPLLAGASGYAPRGPAPTAAGEVLGAALWEAIGALATEGVDVLAADGEVPAADDAYGSWLRRGRFRPIEEIQPSRHRITLPLGPDADEGGVLAGVAKSTRQRIRKAERELSLVRHDAGWNGADDDFVAPGEPPAAAFDRFYDLLLATGERRDFSLGPRGEFTAWWRRALAAGHLVHLEARTDEDEPIAALLCYRHGRRLSTVHSADRAETRRAHPGALHLLRWRAIQLAIREAALEMDLGGVDVPGARREPREGEPMYGLYQHKRSFGGRWLELAGAHERVVRPNRYRAGRLLAGVNRATGRLVGGAAGRLGR